MGMLDFANTSTKKNKCVSCLCKASVLCKWSRALGILIWKHSIVWDTSVQLIALPMIDLCCACLLLLIATANIPVTTLFSRRG